MSQRCGRAVGACETPGPAWHLARPEETPDRSRPFRGIPGIGHHHVLTTTGNPVAAAAPPSDSQEEGAVLRPTSPAPPTPSLAWNTRSPRNTLGLGYLDFYWRQKRPASDNYAQYAVAGAGLTYTASTQSAQ